MDNTTPLGTEPLNIAGTTVTFRQGYGLRNEVINADQNTKLIFFKGSFLHDITINEISRSALADFLRRKGVSVLYKENGGLYLSGPFVFLREEFSVFTEKFFAEFNILLENNNTKKRCDKLYPGLDRNLIFSKIVPYLTVSERCRLSEICMDDETVIATRNKSHSTRNRFDRRFGLSVI